MYTIGRLVLSDQIHIRNAEISALARALARRTGKTISAVVLDALRQYRPILSSRSASGRLRDWRRLLREDRDRGFECPETPIEALYDGETGLPG
jgi:hypothetical protein